MSYGGINVRKTGSALLFEAFFQDVAGDLVTSGTANLRCYEVQQSDGTLKSYDFNDNTFKTGALTTATASMIHRQGNNNTYNTGYWNYLLSTVSGFTAGGRYLFTAENVLANPPIALTAVQYGGAEGDIALSASGNLAVNVLEVNTDSTAATRLSNLFKAAQQGTVDSATFTPTTTVFETSFTSNTDKFTNQAIYFVTGANAGITRNMTTYAYTNSKVKMTLNSALPTAPSNGDIFLVFGKAG